MNIDEKDKDALYETLEKNTQNSGYHLNPDRDFTKQLITGLLVNQKRYGYQSCPCRLASGIKEEDLDIICPCDYRDPDLNEYDACYCGLYVSQDIVDGKKKVKYIPERRPKPEDRKKLKEAQKAEKPMALPYPVWRCKVCGYLCARNEPPEVCPICKVSKDRFEKFMG
jgi:ferredoxin-thioredoxin reductase catalytic chain